MAKEGWSSVQEALVIAKQKAFLNNKYNNKPTRREKTQATS